MGARHPRPFLLLGLLFLLTSASWTPAVGGIEAVSQHHSAATSTTWQVLHAAFHRYGISPYPDFIPWQSAAPAPAAAPADQPHAAANQAAASAAATAAEGSSSSRMQCSAAGACSQVEAAAAAPAPAASDTEAVLQQPMQPGEASPAAQAALPTSLIPLAAGTQEPAATSGSLHHHAAAAAAAGASGPAGDVAQLASRPPVAAAGVQDAVQPHATPTPPAAAAPAPATPAPARQHRPPPVRRLLNLAELSDGASVLAANPEARRPERAIDRDIDSFMKNDCDAEKWMIIELSQLGTVETVKLTMKELYSSRVHTFRVLGRSSHPRKDGPDFTASLASGAWQLLGSFTAENKRGMQSFSLPQRSRVRYLLLVFDTHYGNEQMCAMNWIEVLGVSAAQELEEALALQELEAEHEEHQHAHAHDSQHLQQHHHHQQHEQQHAPRHAQQQQQLPAAQPHPAHQQQDHLPLQQHSPPAHEQHHHQQQQQQPGVEQQRAPPHQHEQPQQQQAQAVPPATQAHPPGGNAQPDSPAAARTLHEHAAAAGAGAAGVPSSHQQAAGRQAPPPDQVVPAGSQSDLQDSRQQHVPERPGDTPAGASHSSSAAVPAAVGQPPDLQQQNQQQQPPTLQGDSPRPQGQPVAAHPQLPTPTGPAGVTSAAPTPSSNGAAAGGSSQGVAADGPSTEPQQQSHGGQQQQQQQPPQQPPAASKEAPSPGAASPVQQQQQAATGSLTAAPAARDAPVALGPGAGQDAGAAGPTASGAATQQPPQQQQPAAQTGPTGSRNGNEHHMPSLQQQQQQQPPVQTGQAGSSNGGPPPVRAAADTGSVLDSRGSNKPKQAGNLFDVVKSEMMQLKLDQGKLTKKVDSLTKRNGDFEATAAALQQQQAALSQQLERLSKKLDALIGTQAAAAAAQKQLRKDVGMLLAEKKERQGRGYTQGGPATAGTGGYGVGPDTVLPDLHGRQPGSIVDATGRPLLPPVCARVGEEPPLLMQSRYQWSVVTALAGTSLLGLWLVLHPKSLGMPQVLRLVVCVLALLNGILAVLLGLWLVVMQGLASQGPVLLTPDPRLSMPVYRMLGNGSAWSDAPL